MTTLTLAEAISLRLQERQAAQEMKSALAIQIREDQLAVIENEFKEWVHDTLHIALPDDVQVEIPHNFRVEALHGEPFPIRIRLFPNKPARPSVLVNWFRYTMEEGLQPSLLKHEALPEFGFESSFGDFVDAVIYALGGERGLAKLLSSSFASPENAEAEAPTHSPGPRQMGVLE